MLQFHGKKAASDDFTRSSTLWVSRDVLLAKMMSTCSCEFVTNFPLCFPQKIQDNCEVASEKANNRFICIFFFKSMSGSQIEITKIHTYGISSNLYD